MGEDADTETSNHQPSRPSWHCEVDGEEWPCPARRDELLAEANGSRIQLSLLMNEYFHLALDDNPGVPPRELYQRFMVWPQAPINARPLSMRDVFGVRSK